MINSVGEVAMSVRVALRVLGGHVGPAQVKGREYYRPDGASVLGAMMRKELGLGGNRRSDRSHRREEEISDRILAVCARLRVEDQYYWPHFEHLVEGGSVNSLKRQINPRYRKDVEERVRVMAETIENAVGAVDIRELLSSRV